MSGKADMVKKLEKLVLKRDRVGKKPLSNDQRIKTLEQIYDATLFWLQAQVTAGKSGGCGAATTILSRAREEIVAWQNDGVTKQDHVLTFELPGLDFSDYEKEKTADA